MASVTRSAWESTEPLSSVDRIELRHKLLAWYRRNKRDLPWRRRPHDAYAQWLAETMLQQTRVETVFPYYRRFRRRFPTVRKLARAPLDEVLRLWAGLGYYSRARNLHLAARCMVERHNGRVPNSLEALRALPGIGRYTAGAVASIAYGIRAPILDGNVARVLSRICAVGEDISLASVRARLWRLAEALLPRRECGDFNQALMDFGAIVCTPRAPRCPRCPLRGLCRGHAQGRVDELPRRARGARTAEKHVLSIIVKAGPHVLVCRRPEVGLWAGLWEPPGADDHRMAREAVLKSLLGEEMHEAVSSVHRLGSVSHQLTHRLVRFSVFLAEIMGTRPRLPGRHADRACRWVRLDRIKSLPISRAHLKVFALLDPPRRPGPALPG